LWIKRSLLEASECRHKCLFQGQALQDSGDAAPWLVQLAPDNVLTRQLMSSQKNPGGMWEMELGIFVKSALPFDPDFEVVLLNHDLNATLKRVPGTVPPIARPVLTTAAHRTIRQVRRVQQYEELIEIAMRHVKGKTDLSDSDVYSVLRLKRDGLFEAGFWQRDHLVKLMVWEVLLGPDFITHYASGAVKAIILAAKAPYEAIMKIEIFLEAQEARRKEQEEAGNI